MNGRLWPALNEYLRLQTNGAITSAQMNGGLGSALNENLDPPRSSETVEKKMTTSARKFDSLTVGTKMD